MTQPLSSQNPQTVHIDEQGRKATATVQWLLENDHTVHPITAGNNLSFYICGQEAFEHIYDDIFNAKQSVDIVCWGFDPAMELKRTEHAMCYGELLKFKATKGIQIRILAWYDTLGSDKLNNLIGYSGITVQLTSSEMREMYSLDSFAYSDDIKSDQDARWDYCVTWWREALKGAIPNLEVRFRKGIKAQVKASLASEKNPPYDVNTIGEKTLLENFATHHQKPILIDYLYDQGSRAIGYVMGLNSITDFWDTEKHIFNDPKREPDWLYKSSTAKAKRSDKASAIKKNPITLEPYQDYASRIEGQALVCVNNNFYTAWDRAEVIKKAITPKHLKTIRAVIPPKLKKQEGKTRIQIVRTQPEEEYIDPDTKKLSRDKTIKKAYLQATSFARKYIYLENQYFFYEEWAQYLKDNRALFMSWLKGAVGKLSGESPMLHVFIVIPSPEDDGMVPRTYDTAKSLGMANNFPKQDYMVKTELKIEDMAAKTGSFHYQASDIAHTAARIHSPARNMETGELEGMGLKVCMARMVTYNDRALHDNSPQFKDANDNYRQVYIHSKLMLIDDAFAILGSANLNMRSMAADSEMNMCTDDHELVKKFRARVWKLQTGDTLSGGEGEPKEIAQTFKNWMKLMDDNKKNMDSYKKITGFLIPFEDKRAINFRRG